MLDHLESRRLLSASFANGVLTITGTEGADTIRMAVHGPIPTAADGLRLFPGPVVVPSGTPLVVYVNDQPQVIDDTTGLRRIVVRGLGGDDSITLSLPIAKPGASSSLGFSAESIVGATIDGGAGNDTISGNAGNDALRGNAGDDQLFGEGGGDVLRGNDGDDRLHGSTGDDRLFGGRGNDTLDGDHGTDLHSGGAGRDQASYANRYDALRVSLDGKPNDGGQTIGECLLGLLCLQVSIDENENVLPNIEVLVGGHDNDTLIGNDGPNVLAGGDGDDLLLGGPGNDLLFGQAGDARLRGGTGHDDLYNLGGGADTLKGGDGSDGADHDADDTVLGIERAAALLANLPF